MTQPAFIWRTVERLQNELSERDAAMERLRRERTELRQENRQLSRQLREAEGRLACVSEDERKRADEIYSVASIFGGVLKGVGGLQ